jgi:2'-5' RNA ligase
MYIWLGINVNDQLLDIRRRAESIEREMGAENSCYTLPMHVSLKISFDVDENKFDGILEDVTKMFSCVKPFDVDVRGIENETVIVWIRMEENERLNAIHDQLNDLLLEKYGVPLHEYDRDYKFHTTLFMDSDADKLQKAFDQIKDEPLPRVLRVNKFVIGTSPNGHLGTFSVYKEVCI